MLARHALPAGRLTGLGATRGFTTDCKWAPFYWPAGLVTLAATPWCRCARPAGTWSSSTTCRAGHRAAVRDAPLVVADIADQAAVRDTIQRHRVTSVMHFAALLSVGESVRSPARYYAANVTKTLALLDAMVAEGVQRLVFSSSPRPSTASRARRPITEDHPTRPTNPYGETKLAVENLLPHYERAYGLRAVRLRYFNAAGAAADGSIGEDHRPEEHLIPRALSAARGGPPLVYFGADYHTPDGTCLRDYVHVSDLAAAHVLALAALEADTPLRVCNLGSGRGYSVREVVAAVERVTGLPVPCRAGGRRPGDPAELLASSARARSELGWEPEYGELDVIVETAWRWQRSHPAGYAS